jgi:hypothetical protein
VSDYTIKDKVAIVGIGETQYYKAGQAPVSEFQLALEAIQKAVSDAGLHIEDVDGFASYSDDRNDPTHLAAALGIPQIQFSGGVLKLDICYVRGQTEEACNPVNLQGA